MCGISGFLSLSQKDFLGEKIIKLMVDQQKHRGPDNLDTWIDNNNSIALGHNRLAILDLSPRGNQPMFSSSKRYAITFNGEIYNHLKIRSEINNLKKVNWISGTDTETILEAVELFGISESLKKFKGMFAFAIWDQKEKKLIIVRDRFGEKPLYYGWISNSFVFSSELKSLKILKNFRNELNLKAISCFLRLSYIPSPLTIFKNIYKLSPGEKIEINQLGVKSNYLHNLENLNNNSNFRKEKWWKPKIDIHKKIINENKYSIELENEVHDLIEQSVKLQMVSDVENGVLLSGGVDSSLITALYQKNSTKKIKSFTIGSTDHLMDESTNAKKISKVLGTDHNEILVNPKDQIQIIEKIPEIYDEPFADSSQIPSILISDFAKKSVKVSLTGDGGDEIFGGYNRYLYSYNLWKVIKLLSKFKATNLLKLLDFIPLKIVNSFEKNYNYLSKGDKGISILYEKIKKISDGINNSGSLNNLYLSHVSSWQMNQKIINNEEESYLPSSFEFEANTEDLYRKKMQSVDVSTYLPDDILCKTDRASMYSSLENRSPFLDSDIYDLANSLPSNMKFEKRRGKVVLKNILKRYLPISLYDSPKKGFSVPIGNWLRNELFDWSSELMKINNIKKYDFLNFEIINNYWKRHQSSKHDHAKKIWNILVLLQWMKKNNQ